MRRSSSRTTTPRWNASARRDSNPSQDPTPGVRRAPSCATRPATTWRSCRRRLQCALDHTPRVGVGSPDEQSAAERRCAEEGEVDMSLTALRRAGERAVILAAVCTAAIASPALADPNNNNSEKMRKAVTVDRVRSHLSSLQAVADANGGNRFACLPGYDASAT